MWFSPSKKEEKSNIRILGGFSAHKNSSLKNPALTKRSPKLALYE